jgi:hypothetical protein
MRFLLLSLVMCGVLGSAFGRPTLSYSAPNEPGLLLLTPDSAQFMKELEPFVAGSPKRLLDDVLPYTVIVKNATNRHIAGLMVLYYLRNSQGEPIYHSFYLGSLVRQPARMMGPGQARLICPVPFFYNAVNKGRGAHPALSTEAMIEQARLRLGEYTNQPEVHVSLDAVVFEDGEIVGADKSNTMSTLNAYIRAEKDLRVDIVTRDAAQIKVYLEELLRRPDKPSSGPHDVDYYERRRRDMARTLLHQLRISEKALRDYLAITAESGISGIYRRKTQ